MRNTLSEINKRIINDKEKFVAECEEDYRKSIYSLAQTVADDDDIKIVAVAGPSASGKTTSSHILQERLETLGEKTTTVSLDDFYYGKEDIPKNQTVDFESVDMLDTKLIKKCLNEVCQNGKTKLPHFDFKTQTSYKDANLIDIGERGIVIVEGIHALNPIITELVARKNIYKVYVSVNEGIFDDGGNRLFSSRLIRLMRRTLRDEVFRGTDVNTTLTLWQNVVNSEQKNLYCFKNEADYNLKTLHLYEPCLYKERFCALLDKVDKNHEQYGYFIKAVKGAEKFLSLDAKYIPKSSLIREFIG